MGTRRQAREAALQLLYSVDSLQAWDPKHVHFVFDHFDTPKSVRSFAEILVVGVIEHRALIDSTITCASENWSISRMSRVDRALLRLGTFELLFHTDVPVSVVINEAIEVSKRFGSSESPNFINGVLDRLAASPRGREEQTDNAGAPQRKVAR